MLCSGKVIPYLRRAQALRGRNRKRNVLQAGEISRGKMKEKIGGSQREIKQGESLHPKPTTSPATVIIPVIALQPAILTPSISPGYTYSTDSPATGCPYSCSIGLRTYPSQPKREVLKVQSNQSIYSGRQGMLGDILILTASYSMDNQLLEILLLRHDTMYEGSLVRELVPFPH